MTNISIHLFFACALLSVSGGRQLQAQAPETVFSFLERKHVSPTVEGLISALSSPDREVRGVVAGLLADKGGAAAVAALKAALEREEVPSVRISISSALAKLSSLEGNAGLIQVCSETSQHPSQRISAANQLLATGDQSCTGIVVDLLNGEQDPNTRALGMEYIRRLTYVSRALLPEVRTVLLKELRDPVGANRQYASEAMSIFGNKDCIAPLERAISSEPTGAGRQHLEDSLRRLKAKLQVESSAN